MSALEIIGLVAVSILLLNIVSGIFDQSSGHSSNWGPWINLPGIILGIVFFVAGVALILRLIKM